jgi:hypothetical protein
MCVDRTKLITFSSWTESYDAHATKMFPGMFENGLLVALIRATPCACTLDGQPLIVLGTQSDDLRDVSS